MFVLLSCQRYCSLQVVHEARDIYKIEELVKTMQNYAGQTKSVSEQFNMSDLISVNRVGHNPCFTDFFFCILSPIAFFCCKSNQNLKCHNMWLDSKQ